MSKWRFWRQLFNKKGHEGKKGHPRSKISKIGQILWDIERAKVSRADEKSPEVKNPVKVKFLVNTLLIHKKL